VAFRAPGGESVNVLTCGLPYELGYGVRFLRDAVRVVFGISLTTSDGIQVGGDFSTWHIPAVEHVAAGDCIRVRFRLRMNLVPGIYYLNTGVATLETEEMTFLHRRVDVMAFRVVDPSGRVRTGLAYMENECSVVTVSLGDPSA
jgi:lipopolysaccharide transport system ATP-binding protein